MTALFVRIYHFFQRHRFLFYFSLAVWVGIMAYFAFQVRFEENVARFLPDTQSAEVTSKVFENLKIKDKIIVMFSRQDTASNVDITEAEQQIAMLALQYQELTTAPRRLEERLTAALGQDYISDIFYKVDDDMVGGMRDFVYDYLPLFLTEADYLHFDSLMQADSIAVAMQRNYGNLLSPAGMTLKDFIMRDPLGLGGNTLKHLRDFQLESNYDIVDGHIFSKDGSTSFMFISPVFGTGSTGKNERLIRVLEDAIQELNNENPQIRISYFGGPSVAVYNARQIKKDTIITTNIALVIIILFISLVFKRKRAIPLIIIPVLFGALFALSLIFFIKGTLSTIAVGAGSVVFGIALSYSIHMLAHQNHVGSVQQLIKEIAYPLTVGSFTTIGAFAGLLFTNSDLLRDFGLFASLVLIGTTLFCLIYLPHFLKGQAHVEQGKVLHFIERINAYRFEKNKGLTGTLVVLTIVCFFASQRVSFNENMMELNYEPRHLKQAEEKLNRMFNQTEKTILFVTVGKSMAEATDHYAQTNRKLAGLKQEGKINDFASVQQFLVPREEQQKRLKRWSAYWTPEKKAFLRRTIGEEAGKYRFRKNAFDPFLAWLNGPFELLDYRTDDKQLSSRLLTEWQATADSLTMIVSQVRLSDDTKEAVYQSFASNPDIVVFDRAYFTNKWVSAVNDDFYLILYISSFLVFFALWISYGRIELTLMSFLPMLISWVIIIGVMGLLGIQFNIVNIILSTFIFGIGDDFSIFIMDGLQSKYRTGQRVLNSHKTAIFFAAFTMITGMGALAFAKHPALQSISIVSILGMIVVVLVSYTIPPILFRVFISGPAKKGLPPYTLWGILRSTLVFLFFAAGCITIGIIILLLMFVPMKRPAKKRAVCYLISRSCRIILAISTFVRKERINTPGETFGKPGIIIANHQSFIDILVILSFSSKIIMVTKEWVWKSPLFGFIIRHADFFYTGNGYEQAIELFKKKAGEGYSIAIFPEGTRTSDGKIKRFHKGAFYLAETLKLDIIPVLFYGNYRISAKAQPFNLRKGATASKILPRISHEDRSWGTTYQERTKRISAYMREEYAALCLEKDNPDNPYFYETLVQNYIYKGPVEEWYIRIKVKMEKNYRLFDELVPRSGQITDIGCGFGPLCYMLNLLSGQRRLLGIDYDEDKIAVANQAWLRNRQTCFVHADAITYDLPPSDVFILNDMLHYMSYENQNALLKKCMARLLPGGKIIVRDGNTADERKHRLTRFTEWLSTRIIKFNKTQEKLCFMSEKQMRQIVGDNGMQLKTIKNDKYTSNTIYVLTLSRSYVAVQQEEYKEQ